MMMTAAFCILPIILARLLFFHTNLHFLAFSKFFSSQFQNIGSPGLRTTLPPSLPALSCRAPSCSRVAEASSSQRCRCNSSYWRFSNERSTSGKNPALPFSPFQWFLGERTLALDSLQWLRGEFADLGQVSQYPALPN